MGDLVGGNQATVVAEPVTGAGAQAPVSTGQAASPSVGTPNPSGQASTQGQSASVEDKFSNVDPETLPPELKAIYKNLQADYTKKTQGVAQVKQKADYFDQLSNNQKFKDYWTGQNRQEKTEFKEQKAEIEKKLGEKISDKEFFESFQSKDGFLDLLEKVVKDRTEGLSKKNDELSKQLSVKEAADVVESFATQMDKDGKAVRPDFYKLDEDGLITGYLTVNQPEGANPKVYQQKLNEAYTWAKQVTQKYYEAGRQEALTRIQQKAAASTEMPTQAAKGAYNGPDPKKLTPREAIEYAKKGQRIPQVYD